MTDERYAEADKTGQLTEEEFNQGWHFCLELDGALVNHVGCENTEWCKCLEDTEKSDSNDR